MAITDVYQDLIMNPENMPNRLQNLEMFPPVDNIPGRFDAFYDSTSNQEIPGFNFVDAPTSLMSRFKNPQFLNNPRTGIIDASILSRGNPENSLINRAKSGISQGLDLGRSAIGGILSLITGLPGVSALTGAFTMSPEEKAMRDFYEQNYGLTSTGQVASGIMQGYNPVSMFGGPGLTGAIDKRIDRIQKTLQKKKSTNLENRLKELQELKEREAKKASEVLEAQRRGRRPGTGGDGGGGGVRDSGGPTGGYSYDSGGREGFGYGL